MAQFPFTPQQMQAMLQMAGQRLGTDPAALGAMIEKGDVSGIAKSLGGPMGKQLRQVLADPQRVQQMVNSPEARQLMEDFQQR